MVKNIRESVMDDILDAIKEIPKDWKKLKRGSSNSLNVSSISRASKDLVMSFPVLCDDSIDPKTAAMICKAIERKCVSMLQMIFASCSFNADNGREIIAQWHNNIDDSNYTLDDYLDLCDQLSNESYIDSVSGKKAINEAVSQMKIEMKNSHKVYPSSVSESSVNDYKVNSRHGDIMVTERASVIEEVKDWKNYTSAEKVEAINNANKTLKDNVGVSKDRSEMLSKQLMDTDVKKCNELVPSLMIIRFTSGDKETGPVVSNEFIAGVKARLIPVDSYEIIDRIVSKNKDRSGLTNLIRATTNEISFVKDYLLAIDKAKIDAKNNSVRNKSSRIWKTLEKRSTKSVLKRLLGRTNDAGCITTLVISAEVANMLKKEYGINIADVKTASTIMDAYNLLALVIVDESTEVARFLFDGDSTYEDLSFNSLERESGDGSYKKIINLLSKTAGVGR